MHGSLSTLAQYVDCAGERTLFILEPYSVKPKKVTSLEKYNEVTFVPTSDFDREVNRRINLSFDDQH